MADSFAYLKGQQVKKGATIEFELVGVKMPNGKSPVFVGKLAGNSNKPYLAALVKLQAAMVKVNREDDDEIEAFRLKECELYARHVIVGWKNVVNDKNDRSEFTPENCAAFLQSLSEENLTRLVRFFSDSRRFTYDALSDAEAAEVGNGSPKS